MKIQEILKRLGNSLWEMTMKTEFGFQNAKMDYKDKELYTKILVDNIAPYYFAVIKEFKYHDDLDDMQDKYRASLEYQSFAYGAKDYNPKKAKVLNGAVRHFSDFNLATKWLKLALKEYFAYTLKVD